MEGFITVMSHGTPANIKLDNSRSVSKQLTRQGEMSFLILNIVKVHLTETLVSEPAQLRTYWQFNPVLLATFTRRQMKKI